MHSKNYFNELIYSNAIEKEYWNWCEKTIKVKCKESSKSISSFYYTIDKIDLSINNYQLHYKSKIQHFQEKFKELKDEIDKEMKDIIIVKQSTASSECDLKKMIERNILFQQNNQSDIVEDNDNNFSVISNDIYNVIKESDILKEYRFVNTKQKL